MANHINIAIFLILCATWQAYGQAVNCTQTGVGRFADPTDTTCQNYTYCVLNAATNTYTGYNYVCPATSVFNPTSGQCTDPANYNCVVTTTVPTTIVPTTTVPTTIVPTTIVPTTTVPTTTVAADPCVADGYVPDPTSTDCSSYIQCVQINGTFDETTLPCPNGTYYNPATTFCDSNYVCAGVTTVTTLAPTTVPVAFTCTAVGRFANTADTTCQSYYFCVSSGTGTFVQYDYTCPTTSVFNPATSQCTGNYVCPTS